MAFVVLVVGVAGAGTVAVRNAGAPSDGGSAELLVAGVGTVIADPTATTVMTVPPMPTPTPTGAPSRAPVTTAPGPVAASPTEATTTKPGPMTTVVPVTTAAPTSPVTAAPSTTVPPLGPRSWELESNGISVRIRIEQGTIRAGDTIEFVFSSSTTVATDFCCIDHLYVGGTMIYSKFHGSSCPIPSTPEEHRVSYVVPQNGLLAFHLQSNRVNLCSGGGPPLFVTANLHASTTVLAAR